MCPSEIEDMIAMVDKNGDGSSFSFFSPVYIKVSSQRGGPAKGCTFSIVEYIPIKVILSSFQEKLLTASSG